MFTVLTYYSWFQRALSSLAQFKGVAHFTIKETRNLYEFERLLKGDGCTSCIVRLTRFLDRITREPEDVLFVTATTSRTKAGRKIVYVGSIGTSLSERATAERRAWETVNILRANGISASMKNE